MNYKLEAKNILESLKDTFEFRCFRCEKEALFELFDEITNEIGIKKFQLLDGDELSSIVFDMAMDRALSEIECDSKEEFSAIADEILEQILDYAD